MLNRFWMKFPLMDPEPAPAGGDAPPFDIAKAFADLTTSVNKTLNGFDAKWSKRLERPAAPPAPEPTPEPEPQPQPNPPADPKQAAFERRLAQAENDAKKAREDARKIQEAADKRDVDARQRVLQSELKTELGKYVDPAKVNDAFKLYDRDVKYTDDGQMVGPDDTPLSDYIKREMGLREREYLLPVKPVGGAGATAGQTRSAALDLDRLKPGMDAAELGKFRTEISRVAAATMAGQII